jgi:hypothetical protein
VAVIVEADLNDREQINKAVNELLEPYNENTEVEPYEEECYCVGNEAFSFGRDQANDQVAKIGDLRDAFWAAQAKRRTELFGGAQAETDFFERYTSDSEDTELVEKLMEVNNQVHEEFDWDEHIKEWSAVEKRETESHPRYGKPKHDCEDCKGTGTAKTTYNPNSRWDWWQIGGRWTGTFADGYNPSEDPNNIEVCSLCEGTGQRTDAIAAGSFMVKAISQWIKDVDLEEEYRVALQSVFTKGILDTDQFSEESKSRLRELMDGDKIPSKVSVVLEDALENCHNGCVCNGCGGDGKKAKWPTQWVDHGNIVSVDAIPDDFSSFAVLTPDGKWHERGKMGMFATVSDEKSDDDWQKAFHAAVDHYKGQGGHVAVVVDCHI